MHAGELVAINDLAERSRAADQVGDTRRFRVLGDRCELGSFERQIDQHDASVARKPARERNRGRTCACFIARADHREAPTLLAGLLQLAGEVRNGGSARRHPHRGRHRWKDRS
jgi:hypothetical protein